MAVYRPIQSTFWQDDFILAIPYKERWFYIWLFTNPKVNQCGCYKIVVPIAELELGIKWGEAETLINKFVELKKIKFDKTTKEVLILNWYKHNRPQNPSVLQNIRVCVKEIINTDFKKYCVDTLLGGGKVNKAPCIDGVGTVSGCGNVEMSGCKQGVGTVLKEKKREEEDDDKNILNMNATTAAERKQIDLFMATLNGIKDFWTSDFIINLDKTMMLDVSKMICACLTAREIKTINLKLFEELASKWFMCKSADSPQRYFRKCFEELTKGGVA